MARKFHNLAGWLRDVRAALAEGDQLAYELAELLIDVDDLVDPDVDTVPTGIGEDELLDADGGAGTRPTTELAGGSQQALDPGTSGVVRVGDGRQRRSDGVLADTRRTGGGRPDGRAPVLTDAEFAREARARGIEPGKQVRRGS